jgi:hypothetical protein
LPPSPTSRRSLDISILNLLRDAKDGNIPEQEYVFKNVEEKINSKVEDEYILRAP